MKVRSFMQSGPELAPVEVELTLTPGLPQIQFLGLPDTALRESAVRIRSALREQGFELPQAHQILVNLTPTYLRKSSRGLDLAVAAAILWETGQLAPPEGDLPQTLYGELTLKGEVLRPDDIENLDEATGGAAVWTAPGERALPFSSFQVRDLKEMRQPLWIEGRSVDGEWTRPIPQVKEFPVEAAKLAAVIAAGEHSALLAGPPGGGKTTLAEAIPCWLDEPEPRAFRIAQRLSRRSGRELAWRPVLRPHHSITPLAMIGGGAALWAGEIARGHGGVLIMDELLEFHSDIQEALREPVESGQITIVRAGSSRTFPARFLLIATTNLCACGLFVPRRDNRCRCPRAVRRKGLLRLSGPFTDRFALLVLTDEWGKSGQTVSVGVISEQVARAIEFRKLRGQEVPNSRLSEEEAESMFTEFQLRSLVGTEIRSRRRRAHLLRVARTLADLRLADAIGNEDLDDAVRFCLQTHRALEGWQD